MSKASCCCGASASAAAGAAKAIAKATRQKFLPDVKPLRQIARNMLLSRTHLPPAPIQPANLSTDKLSDRPHLADQPSYLVSLLASLLVSLAATTSISTRNPGLA